MSINQISQKGLSLIKKFEGIKLKPYLCPAGIPTISIGCTYYEDGTKVKMTDASISQAKATDIFLNVISYLFKFLLNLILTVSSALVYFNLNEKLNFTGTFERIQSIGKTKE